MVCSANARGTIAKHRWSLPALGRWRRFSATKSRTQRRSTVRFTNSCGLGLANVKVNLLETIAFDHQLIVLRRKLKGRARLTNNDRWFFVWMYRWFPTILKVVTIVQPDTLVRWHRASFRRHWRW